MGRPNTMADTDAPDPIDVSNAGGVSRSGLAAATAIASAVGVFAVVAGRELPLVFAGQVLGAILGTALVGGTSADAGVGAGLAAVVAAPGVFVGVLAPGLLADAGAVGTALGTDEFVALSLTGVPIVVVASLVLDSVRNRVRRKVIS